MGPWAENILFIQRFIFHGTFLALGRGKTDPFLGGADHEHG